ncbi:hypothetical protein MM221_09720 [Salipaludibacillus sp. LMS25]|jgi:hypothetical protein|uniref:hypothetical protein n=1 Tax=Salipaludibacillus sp. LMS25 TaxID=2924031 RepID=UPI0020D102C3|nr:hypothetical protein [Salipaludibacillus sp. LMS25]UTR16760.1 hypothetical protein MM221_09720 [Salipaludibacillus sp. LMS25]
MPLMKKSLTMIGIISAMLVLTACVNGGEASNNNPAHDSDGPQDGSPDNVLPLSDALEEYPVWIGSRGDELSRNTVINIVITFEEGVVKYYDYEDNGDLKIEDVVDISDQDIVKHAEEYAEEINLGEYTLNIVLDEYGNNTEMEQLLTQSEEIDIEFSNESVSVQFFGTNFSGMNMERFPVSGSNRFGTFLTRTGDSLISFMLDSPDTESENVTIESE